MIPIALDCESALIEPGRLAPPLACVSVCHEGGSELFHHTEARAVVEELVRNDRYLLVGDNVAYDFSVFASEWPDLMPAIFEAYDADRVSDTEIREKLIHIASGIYRRFERTDGEWVKLNYSLADLARRHLSKELEKGTWQLRFGELRDVPLAFWPEEARRYALTDAEATLDIWFRQQSDQHLLDDEFRQSRAGWWLRLTECWGMITEPAAVQDFSARTLAEFELLAAELESERLVSRGKKVKSGPKIRGVVDAYQRLGLSIEFLKLSRSVKEVQKRVVEAYARKGIDVYEDDTLLTDGGEDGSNKKPKTDADVCERSGDPVLGKYAELSSLSKTLSSDVPLLESGTRAPIKVHYEVLLETGRTSSTPNVQNWPTDGWSIKEPAIGMRECVAPRDGYVFATSDYSGAELRTWSQVCITMFGESRMAEALKAGMDPHLEIARRILGISYEEALADYKRDPKGRVYLPRQSGKTGNFGLPGGLGQKTFVEYARKNYGVVLTKEKAAELIAYWRESWPESIPYFEWIGQQCNAPKPVIKQLFSNRFRGNVRFPEAANSMFQGLAADMAKNAGFLIARACYADENSPLFGSRIVNFVHDEFVLEVRDDSYAHEAAEELARLMVLGARPFLPDVPAVAEALLCRRWSKAAKAVRRDGRLIPWDFDLALEEQRRRKAA